LTILLTPLVPCASRLAVLAVLAPLFFGSAAVWVSVGVVGLNLLLLVGIGFALHELVLGGEHVAFIMELPLYHLPNARTIALTVWQRTFDFLKKAGSVIVVVSVLVWYLSIFPHNNVGTSYLAGLGHFLSPLGAWMGLDWRMMMALLTSVVAKENTIATLGILYQAGQPGGSLAEGLAATVKPAAALAFLVVQMSFVPCVATIATIRQETRSWKWTAVSVGLLLVISMVAGVTVYQVARLVR
jgi:ferrous iron transport protein B